MIRLKNILSESKVGYLVEKPKKKAKKTGNPALDKEYTLVRKSDNSKVKRTGASIQKLGDKRGEIYTNYPQVVKQIKKAEDKQKQDKAQKKSAEEKANKIKNTNVKALDKKTGEKINVKVDDVLPPPFGSAKKLDDKKPGTQEAKKVVYDMKVAEAQEQAKKEAQARKKKGKGKFKLTSDEQKEYKAWIEENPFGDDISEEKWFTEQKPREEMSVFNPDTGQQWEEDPFDFDDFGDEYDPFGDDDFDFDDGFGKPETDDFSQPLSKLGSKQQQSALELKVKVPVGSLNKVKLNSNHRVKNQDGNPTKLSVFQDPKTNKYYGIDDEGNIYENDTDDFRDVKEPTADAKGFPGAVNAKGQALIDMRAGKQKEDEYDKTSFADLLDLLGIDTDIDYTNPFAGN